MAQHIFGTENVDSYYIHDEEKGRSLWNYIQTIILFPFGYYNGITPKDIKNIITKAEDYDYVFLNTSLFGIVAKKLHENGYTGTIIAHFHNVENIYYEAILPKLMPGRNVIIRCAKRNDGYSCRFADKIIVLNERDSRLIESIHGRKADMIIPIALQDRFVSADENIKTSSKPLCLFIGSCFQANNEGVLWFVKNVLPYVDIRFKIVGKGMAKLKADNECLKDIEVISDAPDLTPYFTEADFMILPIFSGSGMKVKTCESLMFGKNILGTDETFEGYNIEDQKIGGRCNSSGEYINCINHYCKNPIMRFNKYSRRTFIDNYSESATESLFRSVFDEIL